MKHFLKIILFFLSLPFFSQNSAILLKQISTADTVVFTAKTSGCFNAGTNTYKFVKQKNKEHKVFCDTEKVKSIKKITAKNYDAFLKRFEASVERFKDPDEKQLCTTISEFEMSSKKGSLKFINGNCLPEFDPEDLLIKLLK